jgi:hypothetical protein
MRVAATDIANCSAVARQSLGKRSVCGLPNNRSWVSLFRRACWLRLQGTKHSYTLTIEPAHFPRNVGTHETTLCHSPKEITDNLRRHRSAPHPQTQRSTSHAQVLSSISILILYQLFPSPRNPCLPLRYLNVSVCVHSPPPIHATFSVYPILFELSSYKRFKLQMSCLLQHPPILLCKLS